MNFFADDPGNAMMELTRILHQLVEKPRGRYRCEDLVSAIAAFAGEACMRQAAEFDCDNHRFAPGTPVFSQKVNVVLSGDRCDWAQIPATSAFGRIFNMLTQHPDGPWSADSFPDVAALYRRFAEARRGTATRESFGKAPLSIPGKHFPVVPPLRAAHNLRCAVFARWPLAPEPAISVMAQMVLLKILLTIRPHLDEHIALTLALETMNAMAKTAPLLPAHMEESASEPAQSA